MNLTELAADIADVISDRRLRAPHFVGHGLGGVVGLDLATMRPDAFASMTAIATVTDAEPHADAMHRLADHIECSDMAGTIDLGRGHTPVVELLCRLSFGPSTRRLDPDLVMVWERRFTTLRRIAPSVRAHADRPSITGALTALRSWGLPVLAIAGAQDSLYSPADTALSVAAAAGGQHVTIQHAGHNVVLERPGVVMRHLIPHFRRAESAL